MKLSSLRHRLLVVTLLTAVLTTAGSAFLLSALFRDHVRQQFVERLSPIWTRCSPGWRSTASGSRR